MNDNNLPLAREWFRVQELLAEVKQQESDLRKQTIAAFFGENMSKGTRRENLSEKMELVYSQSATIVVDKDAFIKHKAHMESLGLIGDDKVIKLKPEVSVTAYKYLSDAHKVMFDEVFVHKMGSPSLKVEPIKEKKED